MTELEEFCRVFVEGLIETCVVQLFENKDLKADVIMKEVGDDLQAGPTRRNNLNCGVGCVIVNHYGWTSGDGDFEVPVHTKRTYELYDAVGVHNINDSIEISSILGKDIGEGQKGVGRGDDIDYIVNGRKFEMVGIEIMTRDDLSAKYSKKKKSFAKKCRSFFKRVFGCCVTKQD